MNSDPKPLPDVLSVFPLTGALLLPRGELPLNIFEPRYVAMIEYALSTPARMVGMVQPRRSDDGPHDLYDVGCAGRINSFHETNDGRYLITLLGIKRFQIVKELPQRDGFRLVVPNFSSFMTDESAPTENSLDRIKLMALLKEYFKAEGLSCNWDNVKNASDDMLISALSMACPLDPAEKQALLEAPDMRARGDMFLSLLEMAVMSDRSGGDVGHHQLH